LSNFSIFPTLGSTAGEQKIVADRLDYQTSGDSIVAVFKNKHGGEWRVVGLAALQPPMVVVENVQ
jgi:hypothetical protein